MKEILLSQNKKRKYHDLCFVALVDDEDYEKLNKYKWHVDQSRNTYYATRDEKLPNGKWKKIKMHRELLCLTDGKAKGDHRDGNGLNNQKYNLRTATNQQNKQNSQKHKNNTSGFKGVSYNKFHKKWQAYIAIDYRAIHLGYFLDAVGAAIAYNVAAEKHFGEFAYLNFQERSFE